MRTFWCTILVILAYKRRHFKYPFLCLWLLDYITRTILASVLWCSVQTIERLMFCWVPQAPLNILSGRDIWITSQNEFWSLHSFTHILSLVYFLPSQPSPWMCWVKIRQKVNDIANFICLSKTLHVCDSVRCVWHPVHWTGEERHEHIKCNTVDRF